MEPVAGFHFLNNLSWLDEVREVRRVRNGQCTGFGCHRTTASRYLVSGIGTASGTRSGRQGRAAASEMRTARAALDRAIALLERTAIP
jgi:hypothetical protein